MQATTPDKQLRLEEKDYEYIKVNDKTFSLSSTKNVYNLTPTSCNCSFMRKMGLPCRHLLKLRSFLSMPLFDELLANQRWTRNYYFKNLDLKAMKSDIDEPKVVHLEYMEMETSSKRILSQAQKFNKLMKRCQVLASLGSEGGMKTFEEREKQIDYIIEQWQQNKEVKILQVDQQEDNGLSNSGQEKCTKEEICSDSETSDDTDKLIKPNRVLVENLKSRELADEAELPDSKEFTNIVMPPKIQRKGRPRGAETTAIGLPLTKKMKSKGKKPTPFRNLSGREKDKLILNSLADFVDVQLSIEGKKLLTISDIKGFNLISDVVRDENVDINQVEQYFDAKSWVPFLEVISKKTKTKWKCSRCVKNINQGDESILCERCLIWCHLSCTSLKVMPKAKNWFCKLCISKYT